MGIHFPFTINLNSNLPGHWSMTDYSSWSDPGAGLNHTNYTHDIRVTDAPIDFYFGNAQRFGFLIQSVEIVLLTNPVPMHLMFLIISRT